jgi:hypothetical protein
MMTPTKKILEVNAQNAGVIEKPIPQYSEIMGPQADL